MSKLNNINATEILFDDFTDWFDYYDYAFIWNGDLYRLSKCAEYVFGIFEKEVRSSDYFLGEEVTPIEIVKIDYITVQKK